MSSKSYAEIQQELKERDLSGLPPFGISVLRNVTLEPIAPYLRYGAMEAGVNATVRFGEFDNVMQEAMGPSELLDDDCACVAVVVRLEGVAPKLANEFTTLTPEALDREVAQVEEWIRTVAQGIRRQSKALLVWYGFETPLNPAYGAIDASRNDGQTATVARLNTAIKQELAGVGSAYFVDLDQCRARVGAPAFYDNRYWHIGRAPYTRAALEEMASEALKFVRALRGKNKKCLVLDCDNTLWGGIIGEDGMAGIKISQMHPGSPYYEFQQECRSLAQRGIILALCSKNNEADVWEVFDKHPEMVLKREDIAAWRINWQDKATNLRELAQELNIGLEHMVFVDDSEFEVNLAREFVPEVEVLHLPVSEAVHKRTRLAQCGLFDTLAVGQEDRNRNAMYRAETDRKKLKSEVQDLTSYLESLEMELEIRMADDIATPRIAQLTQKTNQFNLTTIRYSETDIAEVRDGTEGDVLSLRLRDRFGDSGLVGVALMRYHEGEARLDSFLMSCRVLGRGVEQAFLDQCLAVARARGMTRAIGEYRKTAKNGMVADFYETNGFRAVEADGRQEFARDLQDWEPRARGHFKSVQADVPISVAGGESSSRGDSQ